MIFKEELKENLNNLRFQLENYSISVEDAYHHLFNYCMDYDYQLEDIFVDYIDYETANERAKQQLEEGGLARLYYFMGEVNFNTCDLYKVNGYGNLEEVRNQDIQLLIDEVEDRIG